MMDATMRYRPTLLAVLVLVLAAAVAMAGEDRGSADMTLEGGKRGKVPFPHFRHQDVLQDCQLCHAVFPQKAGAIRELVDNKTIKSKQVMNKQCIACHRARKKAGETTGPLTCGKCHKK